MTHRKYNRKEQALSLKAQGITCAGIAEALGISKSYAHKLTIPDDSPAAARLKQQQREHAERQRREAGIQPRQKAKRKSRTDYSQGYFIDPNEAGLRVYKG